MKKFPRFIFALLLLLFAFPGLSYGWNDAGHMAVAFIAYKNLSTVAKVRVDKLIQLNPHYNLWLSRIPEGTSESTKRAMLFMIAATWADEIKGDGVHVPDGPENGNIPPSDGTAAANIGYSDKAMHKYWHFVDLPFSTDGTPTFPAFTPNAQTQIEVFRNVLKKPDASLELKSYDLVWLMHLVGDVHQPLHSTARFTHQSPKGDAGGNFVGVCNPQCGGNLHSFWDGQLGPSSDMMTVAKIAVTLPPPNALLAAQLDVNVWIGESFKLARMVAYAPPIGAGSGPFPLNSKYRADANRIARERISLAGVRLAGILNAALK